MNLKDIKAQLQSRKVAAISWGRGVETDGLSKIGGMPAVPSGFEWPQWQGVSLAFLAQIDLESIPSHLSAVIGLPDEGMLYFFYDQEQSTWGFDPADRGSWRVVYVPERANLAAATAPDDLSEDASYGEMRIAPTLIESIPDLDRLDPDWNVLSEQESDDLYNYQEQFREESGHRTGGYPAPIQSDGMELECQLVSSGLFCGDASGYEDPGADALSAGAEDWKLLLQLDSDDDAGMMWGDCGRLFFWIREQDLANRDFSNVWMILQCH